jgi:hypothetical protein
MKDWIARAVRTFLQAAVGLFIMFYVDDLQKLVDDAVSGNQIRVDLNFWKTALFACAIAGVIALVSLAHNAVEEWSGRGILKPPSPPAPANVDTVAKV